MPFKVTCPSCRRAFVIQDVQLGWQVQCRLCAAAFRVAPVVKQPTPPAPAPTRQPTATPRARRGRNFILAAVGVLLVVGTVVALDVFAGQRRGSEALASDQDKALPALADRQFPDLPELEAEETVPPLAAAANQRPLKRLHVLLVGDTNAKTYSNTGQILPDDVIGAGARSDVNVMAALFTRTLGPSVHVTRLLGHDVTRQAILRHYRDLQVDADTGLVFFYSGHGAMERRSKQHLLAFESGWVRRNEVVRAMRAKNPAFMAVITNCCSNFVEIDATQPLSAANAGEGKVYGKDTQDWPPHVKQTMRNLFLEHRGLVDVTAAEPGTFAYTARIGGCFTRGFGRSCFFDREFIDANRDQFVSWPEMWRLTRQQTSAIYRDNPDSAQADQLPHAFQLPTASEGGSRRDSDEGGKRDFSTPVKRPKSGVGYVTIHNYTSRTIQYDWRDGPRGVSTYELKAGEKQIHTVEMAEGEVVRPSLAYKPDAKRDQEKTVTPPYYILDFTPLKPKAELGTQYVFLGDPTGRLICLFSY